MPVSQLPQAPFRQDRKVFPTPIIGDVLFSEIRDCNRGVQPFPEYGTPHPNPDRWPNHKLVYIKSVDIERNEIFEFYYAADRESQDLYNFSSGYRNVVGNVGGREFRIVQRSYVTLREDFQPLDTPFETAMPDIPEGKFDGVEYVFFDRQQQPIQEEILNSLYVAEVHTYIETAFLDLKISFTATKSDLVPEKFQVNIPRRTTEQIVEGLAEQPVLTSGQISVSEEQINPDIKVVKIVSREEPEDDISLTGRRAYVEGGPPANVIETYSKDGIEVDTGVLVVQSTVTPLGDGSFLKETVEVESWPVLTGSEFDFQLNAQVVNTQQMVEPPTDFSDPNTSFSPVNEDRTLKTVQIVPTEALEIYHVSLPVRTDIQMPSVLKSIEAIWVFDESISDGDSEGSGVAPSGEGASLTCTVDTSGFSQINAQPSLVIETETVFGSDVSCTTHFFYLNSNNQPVSEGQLITRLSALIGPVETWPTFKPKSHTIVTHGANVSVRTEAKVSETVLITVDGLRGRSVSEVEDFSRSIGRTVDIVSTASMIHGPISIGNAAQYSGISVISSASARVTGENFSGRAVVSATGSSSVSITPTFLPPTSPADIPRSGRYVVGSSAEPFKWGWLKCSAVVVDASQFAP